MRFIPDTIRFLESLGFEFTLDWDDELEISHPTELQPGQISLAIGQYSEQITAMLKRRRTYAMHHCVGGPFNGREHDWHYQLVYGTDYKPLKDQESIPRFHGLRVGQAKWAVYELKQDGRAYFRGFATSEKKAKNGAFVT